jgi:glycine betaine/choline ABC-type transport system substrate-binding protein
LKKILVVLGAMLLAACSPRNSIIVGSKNFTEQILLGEIAAQQIERKLHVRVDRRLGLGGTLLSHEALLAGQIDLYPEYTGTAAFTVLKQKPATDPVEVYMQVKDAYRERFHLIWLPPLGFNDTFAMVVRTGDAQRLPARSLSAAKARGWQLGVGYEFLTRPDGLTRLDQVYRLRWIGSAKTMDLGLLYQALANRQIDMAAANSTDGLLSNPVYTMLADDQHAFPPYNACFVARESVLNDHAGLEEALTLLQGHINDQAMRDLNRQVDVQHRPVVDVARDFLRTQW